MKKPPTKKKNPIPDNFKKAKKAGVKSVEHDRKIERRARQAKKKGHRDGDWL